MITAQVAQRPKRLRDRGRARVLLIIGARQYHLTQGEARKLAADLRTAADKAARVRRPREVLRACMPCDGVLCACDDRR